jgi:adenine-specific DNA-methyltransferase
LTTETLISSLFQPFPAGEGFFLCIKVWNYIDPPYNTGNDFIYKDDFKKLKEESDKEEGELDESGERLIKNQRSSARFHSNWLNRMYPRLKVAKDLLTDDGVIFISIDDNEVANLREICDEVFGEENFIGDIIWNSTKSVTNTAIISVSHTHNLVYFKSMEYFIKNRQEFRLPEDGEGFENPDNDPRGPWKADPFQVGGWRPNQQYEIVNPNTGVVYKPNPNCSWKNDYKKFQELLKDNRIVFGKTGEGGPQRKRFIWEAKERGKVTKTIWDDVETTANGTQLLKKIFDNTIIFDNPKPVGFIKRILQLSTNAKSNNIILDFFSGSATTAHAVMELNAEDGGKRKFIMVQLPEPCDEKSEAYKAGFKNISEIGKERIRRAGEKIKEESKDKEWIDDLDIGFKVFRVADTNIRWTSEAIKTGQIRIEDNIFTDKDALDFNTGFTDIDVVYEIMLRHRDFPLTSKIERLSHIGKRTYIFADSVVVCLEEKITNEIVDKIAAIEPKPLKVIFRDSAFDDDISLKLNTMNRLDVQLKKHNQGKEISYRVEFI